jgi:hypothetical protein
MSDAYEPSTPLEAYKAIIDDLVKQSSWSVSADLVEQIGAPWRGPGPGEPEAEGARELVASLGAEQRRALAWLLREERWGAFHDVLAQLEWWIDCRGVELTFNGERVPVNFAEGMHCDFVGRRTGWEWPKGEH